MKVESFYDGYWPENVPDYRKTVQHIHNLLPKRQFNFALDAGCGAGACTVALSDKAKKVIGVDISSLSLETAESLTKKLKTENVTFAQADLAHLPFENNSFDLILSWGVVHHTIDPLAILDELVRVLEPSGSIILAIYLKTKLTFFHEGLRKLCLKSPRWFKKPFVALVTLFVKLMQKLGKNNQVKDDNLLIESQVEDWFFVPVKHFYSIEEMKKHFYNRKLNPEILVEQTARFKSSSCFIIRGTKSLQ